MDCHRRDDAVRQGAASPAGLVEEMRSDARVLDREIAVRVHDARCQLLLRGFDRPALELGPGERADDDGFVRVHRFEQASLGGIRVENADQEAGVQVNHSGSPGRRGNEARRISRASLSQAAKSTPRLATES